ncbi:MAG TPA: MFS transporter [Tessaracoccus flavescens]|uniref:MFS transporter n=1 Tax=Tessaracoccus flavescens TaxID=399497 RepID=A0A921JR51_9ACTN|nr:MFS transporter [Tessaracoccus flavescens]
MRLSTTRYAALQSAYWSAFCMAIMFASVFLLAKGLSNSQIGIVIATGGLISAVAQPIVAGVSEVSRIPLRVWIAALALLMSVVAAALFIPGLPWLLTAVFFGFLILTVQLILPLVNALGMAALNAGVTMNFGIARAAGSLAFAVVSVAAGSLVGARGPMVVPLLALIFQLALIATALTFVYRTNVPASTTSHPTPDDDTPPLPTHERLTKDQWRKFWILLVGLTLAMASHNLINGFMFQVMQHHGGGAEEMGTAVMIGALVELPTMALWSWIITKRSSGFMLKLAAIFFAAKSLVTWMAGSVGALYGAQTLQLLAFAVLVPASIYYVNQLMPPGDRVKGQAYMTMTNTLGTVVGSISGGILLDVAGVPTMLLVGTVVAAVGAILTLISAEHI